MNKVVDVEIPKIPDTRIVNYSGMNDVNKKAYDVLKNQGTDAAVKHMFNPSGERVLSYAEIRGMY